ncbi:MAG TPA: hypothetical protein VJ697_13390 [Nitrososphaeraceae archaeon]|nr:hypothetical protein [Nitrososphaeraceae archaeon]
MNISISMLKSLDKEVKQLLFGIILLTAVSIIFLSSSINVKAQEGNILKLSDISEKFKALFINNQTISNGTQTLIDSLQNELQSLSNKALENLPRGSTLVANLGNIDIQMYQLEQIGKIMQYGFMNNQTS